MDQVCEVGSNQVFISPLDGSRCTFALMRLQRAASRNINPPPVLRPRNYWESITAPGWEQTLFLAHEPPSCSTSTSFSLYLTK